MGDLPTNDFHFGEEDEYHAHEDGGINYNCVNDIDGPKEGDDVVDNTGIGPSRFKVKDQFTSKQVLIDTISEDALENGYQFKVSSSNKKRWDIKCLHEECKWKAGGAKLSNSENFMLHKFETHTYPRDIMRPHHRQAGKKTLGKILQSLFTTGDRVYRPKDIITDIVNRYRIDISYAQAWRAKNWALNEIRGSPEESFRLLSTFCHNLEQQNPGSITQIDTDGDHRFYFVFMAFGCSIKAFHDYCHPVICIDGAFLKGRYWGTLFIAVGKDGNNQIFPLAFDIGGKKEMITWSPFLRALYRCIGDIPNLAIISDRHNAIIYCVREVFSNTHHGWCNHHIKGNMQSQYKQTKHIEGLFWRAMNTYRIEDFQEALRMIRAENPITVAHLEDTTSAKVASDDAPRIFTLNFTEMVLYSPQYGRCLYSFPNSMG
ncbi:uncharacterized protein LOC123228755 [Mangifera indica]|uniref:uncharacterized protein LOC123228755 n=1 Tax=Mangifera indica TaxID=29780 RepID=UPI001CFAF715|nr:uncharacterized protein LOC123228755 [Mangifera indica]